MQNNLKQQTINSLKWSTVEKFSTAIIQFILGIIIARLLLPSDYGLIGMLAIFTGLSQILIDGGFSTALIQKKNATEIDFSTVFYFNIIIAVLIYIILFFSAPYIAQFYNQPQLVEITRIVSFNFIILSFSIIQSTKLKKDLNFKVITKVSVVAVVISGFVGLLLAYKNFGVWSLIAQLIIKNTITVFFLWFLSKWKPMVVFSEKSLRSMFAFGSRVMGASLLNVVFDNLYLLVIGKFYNAKELGFYTRASKFNQFPVSSITSILQSVFLPSFSKIQDDNVRLIHAYKKAIKLTAYVIFPIMLGIGVSAKPLIIVLLTKKWLLVVPYLQIMVLYGMFYPIHALNLNILNVKGRSDLFFNLEVIKKILIIITIAITIPFGIKIMIFGSVLLSIIAFFINTYYTKIILKYGPWQQIKDFAPSFLLAVFTSIFTYFIIISIENNYIALLVASFSIAFLYLLGSILFKFEEFEELKNIIFKNAR